ncbi:nuclear transport factor 2 family protein [Saccharopolyspora sp. NPDC003752]
MNDGTVDEETTEKVVREWFAALGEGDLARAFTQLDDDVEWVNKPSVAGLPEILPWVGTFHGLAEVQSSFEIFHSLAEVNWVELVELLVDGDQAAAVLREKATVRDTGRTFSTQYVEWFTVRGGKVTNWRIYIDATCMVDAFRGHL